MKRTIPFKAALFDLDGTLLDSLYVWRRVDEIFFRRRGMEMPERYPLEIGGMSYRETAEYTVKNYLPGERWEALIEEWTVLSEDEYAHKVQMKPGALEYLRMLRREGIAMAVVTAMPPNLYEPCLKRLGILELFDQVCSTEHTGGRGKAGGEIYLLAAEKLGVMPGDCAVFEDVLSGIAGAKKVGMQAYCVRDDHSKGDFDAMAALADDMMDSLLEMERVHDFPEARRCVIFTARIEGTGEIYAPRSGDYVLCADGGWKAAEALGVAVDRVIGDFDSSEPPQGGNVEHHPVMKDDTDTLLCVRHGLERGFDRFLIIGGLSGRLDHTMANLQTLAFIASREARGEIRDGRCRATVIKNGGITLARTEGKLSLFSLSDRCRGVTVSGALYSFEEGELTGNYPLGVSNEFFGEEARISVREGTLLIMVTQE